MGPGRDEEMARFARAAAARRVFVEAARHAAQAGARLMPVKGVLLQALAYPDPAARSLTDADALASPGDYGRIRAGLESAGWRCLRDEGYQAAFAPPALGLTLDLHETLFPEGIFRFDTAALFARGVPDEATFGVPVVLPDPADAAAHVLAHAAFDLVRRHRVTHPHDLQRIADRWALEPGPLARRLAELGGLRAARYVLRELARTSGDAFPAAALEALPVDVPGSLLARGLEAWSHLAPAGGRLARVPAAVFFRTPTAALRNVARALRRGALPE